MRKRLVLLLFFIVIGFTPSFGMSAGEESAGGILYTKPIESVIFRHQDHSQKNISCNTCHNGLFAMEAFQVQKNKDFTMASLYKGKYCGACHNGKSAFASDTQCARCHLGTNAPKPPKDSPAYKKAVVLGKDDKGVAFNHESHIKKASCQSCHSSMFKPKEGAASIKMADHSQKKYCFTCHVEKGKDTFAWTDCSRCHKKSPAAPTETIKYGKGAKAVSFKHEKHQLKSGCLVCHPQTFAYRKSDAKIDFNDHDNGKSCFICHAPGGGSAFYSCNRCHKDKPAAKTPVYYPGKLKYKTSMQSVYFHHASHAIFLCNQCHPGPFAVKKGQTKINMTEMLHGQTCGVCHNGSKAFSARECAKCHKN